MSSSSGIPWSRIKALSFDIYGTLIDWEGGIYDSLHATSLSPFLPQDRKTLLLAIERHDTAVQREKPTLQQSQIIAEGLRRYATEDLALVASGKVSGPQLEAAVAQYGGGIGSYPAFADTVAAVQRLGARFKLVPLTNVDVASWERTQNGPLAGVRFDAVYTAEQIGSYKPAAKNFEFLLEHLRQDFEVGKEELCHVAQSLFHDHAPAKDFGLTSVWVDRGGVMGGDVEGAQERYGFKFRVQTLKELADIIDREIGTA